MGRFALKEAVKLRDLEGFVEAPYIIHTPGILIDHVANIEDAKVGDLTFCHEWDENKFKDKTGIILFVPLLSNPSFMLPKNIYILSENPRLSFIKALHQLFPFEASQDQFPEEVHSEFDEYSKCINLGKNILVQNNVYIGSFGHGYERDEDGKLWHFPHLGGVKIGDDVVLGSNCVVHRGTLGDTVIGRGTKLDANVFVSHNCQIGEDCSIAGPTTFGGGTIVGDRVTIGTGVVTRNGGIKIGDDATIGIGAVVTKDVPAGETWAGNPARPISELKEQLAFVTDQGKKLKDLMFSM